ncbi:MAG: CHAD domain-containing protein, partial [Burkholderiales bacterium]|nr:CHAD domain-containing protein [Burkholderiales bacterium]
PQAAARLARLHRQVRRDAARFDKLDDVHRHRLRKRLKRLRYLCEFAAPCFRGKAVRAYLKRVAPAQEALGEFNDVCVARALLQPASAAGDAQAMYALGWLAHEHADAVRRCRAPLAALRKAEPFW